MARLFLFSPTLQCRPIMLSWVTKKVNDEITRFENDLELAVDLQTSSQDTDQFCPMYWSFDLRTTKACKWSMVGILIAKDGKKNSTRPISILRSVWFCHMYIDWSKNKMPDQSWITKAMIIGDYPTRQLKKHAENPKCTRHHSKHYNIGNHPSLPVPFFS